MAVPAVHTIPVDREAEKRKAREYMREYRARKKREKKQAAIPKPVANANRSLVDEQGPRILIEWIESNLRVPSGPLAGKPFVIADWQANWVMEALAPEIQEAGLSIARKNGKSGLIAAVILGGLLGPLNRQNWRAVVTSLTGALAKELLSAVMMTAEISGVAGKLSHLKSPPPGRISGLNQSRIDFLAADRATGHAIGADLAIIDEAGLLQERQRELWNALFSCISGRNGKLWCISIQGDGPMFEEMAQRAETEGVHWRRWKAEENCDFTSEKAWCDGNPGILTGIKSIEYMRKASARAMAAPGNEMHFRAYDLNENVNPDRQVIVGLNDWRACIDDDAPELEGEIVVGIDLGGSVSMTCAAAFSINTGRIKVWGAFPDTPPMSVRARNDRMGTLYDRMIREGELSVFPGRVTPVVPFLAKVFGELAGTCQIVAIGADRYRRSECEQAYDEAGLPAAKAFWRGQGASATADGSRDVRAFQKAVISRRLKTRGSTMLESAIANSSLRFDTSGNPALDKASNNARIDALSAAVIAVGIGDLVPRTPLFGLRTHVV